MIDHSADADFERHFDSLMQRLLACGWILSYSKAGPSCIVWNPKFHAPMGGEAAFLGLATLLAELCSASPLPVGEQALIQMIANSGGE